MRLGDLDKAEAVLRNIADHLKECGQDDLWPATYAAADVINQQRTIDAVPVVRCKDCKKAKRHEIFPHSRRCSVEDYRFPHKETHFCSYGERKDGEG